jgi:lysophosphatidylcholine acyltransferase/lyso-PAF acetyltransferase
VKRVKRDKNNAEAKKQQLQAITDRIKLIEDYETMPPMIVFPEGSVTNNTALLTFKKGAFKDHKPVKICGVKYLGHHFTPFNDMIHPMKVFWLLCVNWIGYIEFYELEGEFDPSYLNLDPNDENSWKIYAEKVRDIISKLIGLKKTNMGYRDYIGEFTTLYNKELRKASGKSGKSEKKKTE